MVSKLFVQALQRKCLIFPGTLSFQIADHIPDVVARFETEASSRLASSQIPLYPDFTEYTPSFSNDQYNKSGWGDTLNGIAFICYASNGMKQESSTCSFHEPEFCSIRLSTLASLPSAVGEEVIVPPLVLGSYLSLKTLIDFPSPTLHFAPMEITFLAIKVLFHANEPEDCFASKLVPFGKYFDLKK